MKIQSVFIAVAAVTALASSPVRADQVPPEGSSAPAPERKRAKHKSDPGWLVDTVVATVGSDVITLYDVKRRMKITSTPLASIMAGGTGLEDDTAQFGQALDDLIADTLVLAEAKKSAVTIPKEEVDAHVQTLKQRNNWTDADFAVAVGMLGFDGVEGYRAHAARELLKSRLLRMKVGARITVSDIEVQEVFDARYDQGRTEEEIHLAHIALPIPDDVDDAGIRSLVKQAMKIRQEVLKGDRTFQELARQYGQDSSAARGGDVGWFPVGRLQSTLEQAAFALKDGEVSDVVQSSFGFHILKVLERRRVPLRDPEEARRRVKWELSEKAYEKGYKDFVMELRRNARIEITYTPAAGK